MSSLAELYALLKLKQEQLMRLQQCSEKLGVNQQEFIDNEYLCLKPELTPETWLGSLAGKFENIRVNGMLLAYQEIESDQFERTFKVLSAKINQLIAEIAALQAAIAAEIQREAQEAQSKSAK